MSELATPRRAEVRVVQASDPAGEAARLAEELGGDVATDMAQAERAVRARVDAGRRAADGAGEPDAGDDDDLLARADTIRQGAGAEPPISDADVEELRHLAADLGRAVRIRARTEAKVAEALHAKVAASTGVAIHPAAITAAAEAVREAEAAVDAADRRIVQLGDPPGIHTEGDATSFDDPVLRRPEDDFDEAHLERRRGLLVAVVLVVVIAIGAAVAVVAGAPVAVVPIAAAAAVAVAVVVVLRGRRAAGRIDEAGSNLLAVGRAVEQTDSGRKLASIDAREAWINQRAALDGVRDEALERLRVARNRWHQLAGVGADPHDPEAVVRAHDPQLAYDDRVTDSSPTVRTVAAFHRRAQARWRVLWARLGREEPPSPEDLEAMLDDALGEHRRACEDLRRLEAAEARRAARDLLRRPLVLVEPRAWVAPGRLDQLLASVPPDGSVVVVEKG